MDTYFPKKEEIQQQWFLIDAEGQSLGRVCTRVADLLRGKDRPDFTPSLNNEIKDVKK